MNRCMELVELSFCLKISVENFLNVKGGKCSA